MQEYLSSGLKLGWLIDPQNQQVEISRQNETREIVWLPTTLSGENILPGFDLELSKFWSIKQVVYLNYKYYNWI